MTLVETRSIPFPGRPITEGKNDIPKNIYNIIILGFCVQRPMAGCGDWLTIHIRKTIYKERYYGQKSDLWKFNPIFFNFIKLIQNISNLNHYFRIYHLIFRRLWLKLWSKLAELSIEYCFSQVKYLILKILGWKLGFYFFQIYLELKKS